jgi:excisionase family DNA binding protein
MSTITQLSRAEFPSRLYRVEEAAEILNIKPKTMRNRISLGQIDIYRVGRGIRISRETLEEIIGCGYVPARKNPRLRKIADVSSGEETNDGAVSSRVDQKLFNDSGPSRARSPGSWCFLTTNRKAPAYGHGALITALKGTKAHPGLNREVQ